MMASRMITIFGWRMRDADVTLARTEVFAQFSLQHLRSLISPPVIQELLGFRETRQTVLANETRKDCHISTPIGWSTLGTVRKGEGTHISKFMFDLQRA
jgi:hypothetical protein